MDDTTKLGEFLREVKQGEENVIEVVRELAEDGSESKTTLALQNRLLFPESAPAPEKKESPRRAHVFHDVDSLIVYLEKNKTKNTVALADMPHNRISVVLDEKAKNGLEIVTLVPAYHQLFQPWGAITNEYKRTASSFMRFVRQNRCAIIEPTEMTVLFERIHNMLYKADSHGQGIEHETLIVECPIYTGTEPVQIEIELFPEVGVNGTTVTAYSPLLLTIIRNAFVSIANQLVLEQHIMTGLGSLNYDEWEYL